MTDAELLGWRADDINKLSGTHHGWRSTGCLIGNVYDLQLVTAAGDGAGERRGPGAATSGAPGGRRVPEGVCSTALSRQIWAR